MAKAGQATRLHMSSTDENPMHWWCDKEWCFYLNWKSRREIAEKQHNEKEDAKEEEYKKNAATNSKGFYSKQPPKRKTFVFNEKCPGHDQMKHKLRLEKDSIEERRVKAVFDRLTKIDLLRKCEGHHTQNANESFHSRIWQICPKLKYFGYEQMQFAIRQGILTYHLGYELGNILSFFGIKSTDGMKKLWKCQEYSRTIKQTVKPKHREMMMKRINIKKTQEVYSPGMGDDL